MNPKSTLLFALTIILVLVASFNYAETARGRLDKYGPDGISSAPHVPVTLYSRKTEQRSEPVYTGSDGMYWFDNLEPGEYILEIWSQGFNNEPSSYEIRVLDQLYTDIKPIVITPLQIEIKPIATTPRQIPTFDVLSDTHNMYYGIAGPCGTILDKGHFVINHNDNWKIPYWVAYCLSSPNHEGSILEGNVSRTSDFRPDPQLPVGSRSELEDYPGSSGYDRGHNAPPATFKRSKDAMSTTFLLSNVNPQTPTLNRGIWKILEGQVRDLARKQEATWIVTGNICLDADSQVVDPSEFIGPGSVAIPSHCFKAILSCDEDGIFFMYAFILPNQREYIPGTPADYQIEVDRLEHITGFDFFPGLDDARENYLESILLYNWPK